jgi:glutamyl-tRNA reductase
MGPVFGSTFVEHPSNTRGYLDAPSLRKETDRTCPVAIVVVGANNVTAPIAVRELFSVPPARLAAELARLRARPGVAECVVLSTCNRTEAYLVCEDPEAANRVLLDHLGLPPELEKNMYRYEDRDALRHLCLVAAGLDSLVLGEPQIFGQVKEAYVLAVQCETVGPVLRRFFPLAFGMVKKVRARTGIGSANVSVAYVAVSVAKQSLVGLKGRSVLVLGAGDMAEATVRDLRANGVSRVYVANRTFERAVRLAERVTGIPVMLHEVYEYLPKADIVISSVATPEPILRAARIAEALGGKPLVVMDISVPRSVDPDVGDITNVHLFNIDDLEETARCNAAARRLEAAKAREMIDANLDTLMRRLDTENLGLAIASLREAAEQVRKESFAKHLGGAALSEEDRDKVDALTRSIVNSVLHHAIRTLRHHASCSTASDKAARESTQDGGA